MCPHWVAGYDQADGKPFVFHQYGKLNPPALLELAPMERLVRHHIWVQVSFYLKSSHTYTQNARCFL